MSGETPMIFFVLEREKKYTLNPISRRAVSDITPKATRISFLWETSRSVAIVRPMVPVLRKTTKYRILKRMRKKKRKLVVVRCSSQPPEALKVWWQSKQMQLEVLDGQSRYSTDVITFTVAIEFHGKHVKQFHPKIIYGYCRSMNRVFFSTACSLAKILFSSITFFIPVVCFDYTYILCGVHRVL